jgi:queuine/archaeosine tRNA-ribosyltransferase
MSKEKERGAPRPSRPYEFMPASIDSIDKGLSLGVKYEKNPEFKVERHANAMVARLPDRTLYCFRSMMPSYQRMIDKNVDEILDLDYYTNKGLLGEMGFKWAMVNSSAVASTYHYKDYDSEITDLWPSIVSDSGGFQLASGAEEFLDPHAIVGAHNSSCDVGIVLDIPLPHRFQKDLLLRAAQIQKKNNQIFLEDGRKSLQFLNVFHGSTFYMRQKFREVVETDDMNRVCLGGVKTLDLIPLVLHAIFVMTTGKKYDQYHVLGVSGLERWIALSYLGHKKIAKLITSDSSSYIQCGINMLMFDPEKLLGTVVLTEHALAARRSRALACSCPVCSTIKYVHGLGLADESVGFRGLIGHNLFTTRSYVDEIWEVGGQTKQEIMTFLRPYYNASKLKTVGLALQAIDMALEEGVEKAAAKYAPYLLEKYIGKERKGLFNSTNTNSADDKKVFTRFDKVLKTYEDYHQGKTIKIGTAEFTREKK